MGDSGSIGRIFRSAGQGYISSSMFFPDMNISVLNINNSYLPGKTIQSTINIENQIYMKDAGKEVLEGNIAPSLNVPHYGRMRYRLVLPAGNRSVSVQVKQESNATPRPTLVIKKNNEIGLLSDLSAEATSSVGWTTIGPIQFTTTSNGVTWMEFWNNSATGSYDAAYFDNLSVL